MVTRGSFIVLVAVACGGCDSSEPGPVVAEAQPRAIVPAGPPVLVEITEEIGLDPVARWGDGTHFMPEITGSGVGLFDYDDDGDLDILHVRTPLPGRRFEAAPNRLYEQQQDGTFQDVTERSGLGDPGFGQGTAIGDTDNDGDLDVYVSNFGADGYYVNQGDGTFVERALQAGLTGERWSTSATFCDYDRDGDLDLFVAHYLRVDFEGACRTDAGAPEYCGPRTYDGEPDRLYRNRGDGTFDDVTASAGIRIPNAAEAKGLGVVCVDLTGDAWADVYVANDGEANQLWVNRGDGTFRDQSLIRGVAFNRHGRAEASMGVAVGDVNGDDRLDLFMTHLALENNTLYLNSESRLFDDRSVESKMTLHDLPHTGFGCGFFDFDHDGDLDLAVVNGEVKRDPLHPPPAGTPFWDAYAEPNLLFENRSGGTFEPLTGRAGSFSERVETSRGLAFGDLDRDGDLDLVLTNLGNGLRAYRNDGVLDGTHWLSVRARTGNRDAIGAQVTVLVGQRRQLAAVLPGSSFLSSNELRAHFGLGRNDRVDSIEVVWPDGSEERFSVSGVDREVTLEQGSGEG